MIFCQINIKIYKYMYCKTYIMKPESASNLALAQSQFRLGLGGMTIRIKTN